MHSHYLSPAEIVRTVLGRRAREGDPASYRRHLAGLTDDQLLMECQNAYAHWCDLTRRVDAMGQEPRGIMDAERRLGACEDECKARGRGEIWEQRKCQE